MATERQSRAFRRDPSMIGSSCHKPQHTQSAQPPTPAPDGDDTLAAWKAQLCQQRACGLQHQRQRKAAQRADRDEAWRRELDGKRTEGLQRWREQNRGQKQREPEGVAPSSATQPRAPAASACGAAAAADLRPRQSAGKADCPKDRSAEFSGPSWHRTADRKAREAPERADDYDEAAQRPRRPACGSHSDVPPAASGGVPAAKEPQVGIESALCLAMNRGKSSSASRGPKTDRLWTGLCCHQSSAFAWQLDSCALRSPHRKGLQDWSEAIRTLQCLRDEALRCRHKREERCMKFLDAVRERFAFDSVTSVKLSVRPAQPCAVGHTWCCCPIKLGSDAHMISAAPPPCVLQLAVQATVPACLVLQLSVRRWHVPCRLAVTET